MPLVLPGQVVVPLPLTAEEVLRSARVTDFRFDLLARIPDGSGGWINEAVIGTLDGVEPGGSVSWEYSASIKGGGSITVTDLGQGVDWLNVRVKPVALIEVADGSDPIQEVACGVFIPSAPKENWTSYGRRWVVELLDKNSILDQDVVTDANGDAVTYAMSAGDNILAAVTAIIQGAGESTAAIGVGSKVLSSPMVWDVGTSRLKIINDLLDAANYFSLWVDGEGQFQATPYIAPADRSPVYALLAPFVESTDESTLMAPEWDRDRDIFSVPNRFVAVGQGDAETPALSSTAINIDPASPFSYPSRARWITGVETGVEAVDQAALDAYAARKLESATSVTSSISVKHIYLPDLRVNTAIRFQNEDADVDILCAITKTSITFDPLALSTTELREAQNLAVSE